jgi:hypothetical protein
MTFGKKRREKRLDDGYMKSQEILGHCGKMLSASKTGYFQRFPGNVVVFNANVCTADGKIWFGDVDVTKDEEKLKALAEALGEKVYVLREMDGRFDNEGAPKLDRAVASF